MTAIFSVLVIVTLSVLVTRVASIALQQTGLSRDAAQFQARSAFTGVGYTTDEAEQVARHPGRRRIVMILMLLGNAGIITTISSLILGFVGGGPEGPGAWERVAVLVGGLALLWALARSSLIDRWLSRIIERVLARWTRLDVRDYAQLLNLAADYDVRELRVEPGDWLEGETLADLDLGAEGVHVLGIHRHDGRYVGVPRGTTGVEAGDALVLYGRSETLRRLAARRRDVGGSLEHEDTVRAQRREDEAQEAEERARRAGGRDRGPDSGSS